MCSSAHSQNRRFVLSESRGAFAVQPGRPAAVLTHEHPCNKAALRVIGMNEKIHGYQASGNANQSGEKDELEIMLSGKTVIYAQHRTSSLGSDRGCGATNAGFGKLFRHWVERAAGIRHFSIVLPSNCVTQLLRFPIRECASFKFAANISISPSLSPPRASLRAGR